MRNLWIGVAGFAGAVARYQVQLHMGRDRGAFPWATFLINVTGCFLLGVASTVLVQRLGFSPDVRAAVTVGFLGAYTTFSTFAYETLRLAGSEAAPPVAVAYVVASVVVGIVAAGLGVAVGRMLI